MFHHANWGRALLAVESHHPSEAFLRQAYEGLKRYAHYFDRERDAEKSGLYDIDNHYETGQEYMSRYTAVDPDADTEHWGKVFRLKGVDVTVYMYELKRALGWAAQRMGRVRESEQWHEGAERIKTAVRDLMWDDQAGMFFDVDPAKGTQTGVKAATCFYPYFTDIVDEYHLPGLKKHLFSPEEFWTPVPVATTSRDDPTFSAEPVWKGKRMNCPWNGRVWPMTNSHIMDALATCAIRFNDVTIERKAAELLSAFLRMMTNDGDPLRPNTFEHYNPLTGMPSRYRGIDDYMHSWVVDLILKYVMGIQATPERVVIHPLRLGVSRADVTGVRIRGRKIDVELRRSTFRVFVDGAHRATEHFGKGVVLGL
jgi:glycogen debranching enzyme